MPIGTNNWEVETYRNKLDNEVSNTVKLGDKEQIGVKELFTNYQPFYTINLLLDKARTTIFSSPWIRIFCQFRKCQNLALRNTK